MLPFEGPAWGLCSEEHVWGLCVGYPRDIVHLK